MQCPALLSRERLLLLIFVATCPALLSRERLLLLIFVACPALQSRERLLLLGEPDLRELARRLEKYRVGGGGDHFIVM